LHADHAEEIVTPDGDGSEPELSTLYTYVFVTLGSTTREGDGVGVFVPALGGFFFEGLGEAGVIARLPWSSSKRNSPRRRDDVAVIAIDGLHRTPLAQDLIAKLIHS